MGRLNRRDDAVKRPSFSIADMMVIVAVVALDCLVARQPITTLLFLGLGGLPMQIALVIGLLLIFRRRGRTQKPSPFLVGFEVVGWICLLIYVVLCLQAVRSIDRHLSDTLGPLIRATGLRPFSTPDMIWRVVLVTIYVTALQVAIALVAGWINQRWWRQTHPEAVPTIESSPRGN
jgi:hypothetical protein